MSSNHLRPGKTAILSMLVSDITAHPEYVADSKISVGSLVQLDKIVGVLQKTVVAADLAGLQPTDRFDMTVALEEVYCIEKDDASAAYLQGAPAFLVAASMKVGATGVLMGVFMEASAANDKLATVKILTQIA